MLDAVTLVKFMLDSEKGRAKRERGQKEDMRREVKKTFYLYTRTGRKEKPNTRVVSHKI